MARAPERRWPCYCGDKFAFLGALANFMRRNRMSRLIKHSPSIVWFRIDLRLGDNPALQAAIRRGGPVVPVFIWAPDEEAPWQPGAASRWWLHQSLASLDESLRRIGSRLTVRAGLTLDTLRTLARKTGAGAVFWNRRYEPAVIERDTKIKETLAADGLVIESFNGALLNEPWTIVNQSRKPFQVFTPFWKHCLAATSPREPTAAPRAFPGPTNWPERLPISALKLEPEINWADGIRAAWQPGEAGAHARLNRFLKEAYLDYGVERDHPGTAGTSRLSPHLHFGEISPRQVWRAVRRHADSSGISEAVWRSSRYLAEVGWREFAHHLLYHFPHTPAKPLRAEFANFPWHRDAALLKAWQKGLTGYPIVDSGMRELWTTGWMHNRVRMIVASFLVKDLLIPWQDGARWFWDTLVDADLSQNTLGWQWTAGCGADAAPFFRIFNPVTQGAKFDPQGLYVRRWCPELSALPDEWLHQPWQAPRDVLINAGVELGRTYPEPILIHSIAREVALEAFAQIRRR